MTKNNQVKIQKNELDIDKTKRRYDNVFYSNIAEVTASGVDAYIEFMQYPPIEDKIPTVRIYLSQIHLKQLFDVLSAMPAILEEEG
ncbi:MAG TPA: hypothetical protein C5S50_04040 [Methanosarcinaceae archaeon]|nr:hypothetical protein [Methanosarcinaceae archaeon]